MANGARCPRCGRVSHTTSGENARAWYCHECRMPFEDVDDGDISYEPPDRRMRREERRGRYPSLDEGD